MPYTAVEFERTCGEAWLLASMESVFTIPYETEKFMFAHAKTVKRIKRVMGLHGRRLPRSANARVAKRIKCRAMLSTF